MKLLYIITMCNLLLAFVITFDIADSSGGHAGSFFYYFGAVCVIVGIADLLIAFCVRLFGRTEPSKQWMKGFLLSAGTFLLIDMSICDPMLMYG